MKLKKGLEFGEKKKLKTSLTHFKTMSGEFTVD